MLYTIGCSTDRARSRCTMTLAPRPKASSPSRLSSTCLAAPLSKDDLAMSFDRTKILMNVRNDDFLYCCRGLAEFWIPQTLLQIGPV